MPQVTQQADKMEWGDLEAPGQGFCCDTLIPSQLWPTPCRPQECQRGRLSFPPPKGQGAQCREAVVQELRDGQG